VYLLVGASRLPYHITGYEYDIPAGYLGGFTLKLKKYRNILILMIDICVLILVCCVLLCIYPESIGTGDLALSSLLLQLILLIFCEIISQYLCRNYKRLWRYAESKEYLLIFIGGFAGYLIFQLLDHIIFTRHLLSLYSLAACSLSMLGMIMLRLVYRHFLKLKINRKKTRTDNKGLNEPIELAIIGAGDAGVKLYEELSGNSESRYHVLYFVDDSIDKIGKRLRNIPVKGPISGLFEILSSSPVKEAVITLQGITPEQQKFILDTCQKLKCRVQILPDSSTLLQGGSESSLWNNVRNINIEELLGREPVMLDNKDVEHFLFHKSIMVTGGGGSIGSELCRQIAKFKPKKLIIVDIYENNAYDIQQELKLLYGKSLNLKIEIASVSDKDKVFQIFERHHPEIVFHAAAHKHVPLMEDNPEEAVRNNILGTYYMVLASEQYSVQKFILISTDKAVNPTNVMGASKRFCEMILQSRKKRGTTEFVAVRFGNVLGSNGSVIPLFKKQIAQGGPVTITDKRIVRFFMTISEAVQLVLQAGAMANRAEIYVLDMGAPVKIIDLAENMIRLSGYVPYTQIPIVEIGLRPGEKLYEELLMNSSDLVATANQKIYIEQQKHISKWEIKHKLKLLTNSLESKSPEKIKNTLKKVVPTYHDPKEVNSQKLFPYNVKKRS
jgi:FlaA1/EpsC-like NDP-sugar epimerase